MHPMPTSSAVTRLTLLPSPPRDRAVHTSNVRRYRVARLQMVDDVVARSGRFDHLKSAHD